MEFVGVGRLTSLTVLWPFGRCFAAQQSRLMAISLGPLFFDERIYQTSYEFISTRTGKWRED